MDFSTHNCGPWWSDGKFQSSVCPKKKPTNAFDMTCAEHDCAMSEAMSLLDVMLADNKFYRNNYGKGFKRTTAALLVKTFNPVLQLMNPQIYDPYNLGPIIPAHYTPPDTSGLGTNKSEAYSQWMSQQQEHDFMPGLSSTCPVITEVGPLPGPKKPVANREKLPINEAQVSPYIPLRDPRGFRRKAYRRRKRRTLQK